MFLNQELKNIQEAKSRLALCSDLRRQLVNIEFQGLWYGVRRSFSGLALGLKVAEQVLGLLHDRKSSRH